MMIQSIVTLNIVEASKLLGAHKETIRRLVASGEIPGVKIGRSWRFISNDLINYMRSKYNNINSVTVNTSSRSIKEWPSQKEKISGGSISATKEKEYGKALGLK